MNPLWHRWLGLVMVRVLAQVKVFLRIFVCVCVWFRFLLVLVLGLVCFSNPRDLFSFCYVTLLEITTDTRGLTLKLYLHFNATHLNRNISKVSVIFSKHIQGRHKGSATLFFYFGKWFKSSSIGCL